MSSEFDEVFDVVVVGIGAAGAAAALSAHESGASVLVLEKGDEATAGGNTRVSGAGWFINNDPERAAVFLRTLSDGYPIAEDVVQTWAEVTATNSEWMRALGAKVDITGAHHTEPEYVGREGADCYGGMDTIEGLMGECRLYDFLASALAERGIEVRFSTPATELITDADGAVVGVAAAPGGEASRAGASRPPVRIGARGGVVLATGGFAANPQMVRDYLRVPKHVRWGSPHSTGDGLKMAQKAGADLWHMDNMMTITGIDIGEDAGLYLALWAAQNYLYVAPDGRRFVNEAAPTFHGHSPLNGVDTLFPTTAFQLIFDERMRLSGPLSPTRETLPVGWKLLMDDHRWSLDNSAEIESGLIRRADTIEELAGLIGVDPETLVRTVDQYNDACAAGRDDHFGRAAATLQPVSESPFYALEITPLLGWSNGGPRRDGKSRVIDTDGDPIDGLYAAGEVSSTYSWRKDGGFHIADALAFGRVSGREAAARASV